MHKIKILHCILYHLWGCWEDWIFGLGDGEGGWMEVEAEYNVVCSWWGWILRDANAPAAASFSPEKGLDEVDNISWVDWWCGCWEKINALLVVVVAASSSSSDKELDEEDDNWSSAGCGCWQVKMRALLAAAASSSPDKELDKDDNCSPAGRVCC